VSDSYDSKPPIEQRKERRRRVLLSGLIFIADRHSTLDCSIKDLSESGARICVSADAIIPPEFFLINIKSQVAYEVQNIRRKGREVRLKILRSVSLTQASSPEELRLRRLLVERLGR
jgi:hypothetical protein